MILLISLSPESATIKKSLYKIIHNKTNNIRNLFLLNRINIVKYI